MYNLEDNKKTQIPIFLFLIALLMFKPAPGVLLGASSVKIIQIVILLVSFGILCYLLKLPTLSNLKKAWRPDIVLVFLLLGSFSLIISTIVGIIIAPQYTSLGDLIELYRYAFYISFYLIARQLNINSISVLIKPIFIFILVVELFGILQFFNIFNVNNHIGLLFTSSESLLKMITHQHRIPSTFQNPNMYGSFLIIAISLILAYITFHQKKIAVLVVYFFLALTILSVFFTTSRTAVICTFGIIIYWIILRLVLKQGKFLKVLRSGILSILIFISLGGLLVPQIAYLDYAANQIFTTFLADDPTSDRQLEEEKLIDDMENPTPIEEELENESQTEKLKESVESVSSFKSRYYYWNLNLEIFKENPVFGLGPMKDGFVRFADNAYIYTLARYGVVGLLVLIGMYLYIFVKSIIMIKKGTTSQKILALTANLVIVGYAVMGVVAEVWYNLQSITLLFVIIGLMFNRNLKREEKV